MNLFFLVVIVIFILGGLLIRQHLYCVQNVCPMFRYLLLLLIGLSQTPLHAQLERENTSIILDYQNMSVIHFADLDNDNDIDLVGSKFGYSGNFVIYHQDDASGQFVPQQIFGDTTWVSNPIDWSRNFELADMNNDGSIDLIPADMARSPFPYLTNNGNGQFDAAAFQYTSADRIIDDFFFRITDLDQDGHQDIVSFRLYSGRWQFFLNRNLGNGSSFEELTLFDTDDYHDGQRMEAFLLFDYDQDGDEDILVVSRSNTSEPEYLLASVYEQSCPLCYEFKLQQSVALGPKSIRSAIAEIGQLDQDGFPDLAISYIYTENTSLYRDLVLLRNELAEDTITVLDRVEDVEGFTIGDYDLDGDEDIWIHDPIGFTSGSYSWLENTGSFPFTEHPIDNAYSGKNLMNIDFNQDGRPDLVTLAYNTPGSVGIRYNEGPGSFSAMEPLLEFFTVRGIHPEDWNGDGLTDFYFFGDTELNPAYKDGLFRVEQVAPGEFSEPERVYSCQPSGYAKTYVDLNQDGLIDAIGLESGEFANAPDVIYTLQQSDGSWSNGILLHPGQGARAEAFTVADWDQDGDEDVLVRFYGGQLEFWENRLNTGGQFSAIPLNLTLPDADVGGSEMYAQDINADGWPDLVVRTYNEVHWTLSTGSAFDLAEWQILELPPNTGIYAFHVADFDQDGGIDLWLNIVDRLLPGSTQRVEIAYFDLAQQTYASSIPIYRSYTNYTPTQVRDYNNDGYPDTYGTTGFRINMDDGLLFSARVIPNPIGPNGFYPSWSQPGIVTSLATTEAPFNIIGTNEIMGYDLSFLNSANVSGEIRWDTTGNCQFDSIYPPRPHWKLIADYEGSSLVANTNFVGRYGLLLPDTTTYDLRLEPPSNYWTTCPIDTSLQVSSDTSRHIVNFAAQALVECPLVRVNIGRSSIRQCFNSTVSISFENAGTAIAEDAEIKLYYDPRFVPVSSNLPWLEPNDSCMVFPFDTISVGEEGWITVEFAPDCEALQLGEEVCFRTTVNPDELCEVPELNWDGANLLAEVVCSDEGSTFEVSNIGDGTTLEPVAYQLSTIVNDDIILYLNGTIILEPGETDTIPTPNNHSLWYLELSQTPGHPYPGPIALLSNQCSTGTDSVPLPPGNLLYTEDGNPFEAITCGEVIGPYDPNDKSAIPLGFSNQHYIERHWPIDYTIQFQNVGSDFARNVILEDTLSPLLDLGSFSPLVASADYRWSLSADGLLRVVFPEINLADSTSNESASHGFFTFRIYPKENAPFETDILNFADIFFDFNPPIRTGTTQHRIRKPVRASSSIISLCEGDPFMGQTIRQDTIWQQVFEYASYDSIQYYHLNVVSQLVEEVFVNLSEPGLWQGIEITADTVITRVFTSSSGCDSLVYYNLDVLTNTTTLVPSTQLTLSPNPANDWVTLEWDGTLTPEAISIINPLGQQLLTRHIYGSQGQARLNCANLPAGSYELLLHLPDRVLRRRFLVQH